MNTNKNIEIVSPISRRYILAQLNYLTYPSGNLIRWYKKIYTKEELGKNPNRKLFAVENNGEFIENTDKLLYEYKFSDEEKNSYVKLYAFNHDFKIISQSIVYYVEEIHDTDIRIKKVGALNSSELKVGERVKLKVNYSIEEQNVPQNTKRNVKWMVDIDGEVTRLIIDGLVIVGGEVNFLIPKAWQDKQVILYPYLFSFARNVKVQLSIANDQSYRFYFNSSGFVDFVSKNDRARIDREYKQINSPFIDQQVDFYYNDIKFTANSYATLFGRDGIIAHLGGFKCIYEFDLNDILLILGHGAYIFYDFGPQQNLEYIVYQHSIGREGRDGLLDYKFEFFRITGDYIHPNALIKIDNIVYNANELGNYLWGMVLDYYGIFPSPNLIAELGTGGRGDEPWEQRSITNGRKKASTLKLTETHKQRVLDKRLEFRLIYEETDITWRKVNMRKRN